MNFYLISVSGGPRRITVPNFVKIGRSVAEILLFFAFSKWPPPPSWIFEILKFYCLLGFRGSRVHRNATFCQNRSICCEDIKIFPLFKMSAVRHLRFVWGIFGPPTASIWGSVEAEDVITRDNFFSDRLGDNDSVGWVKITGFP